MALSPGGLPTTCTVVLLSSKRSTVTVSAQTATEGSTGSRCCCCYCGDSRTKPHIVVNNWYPNSPQSPLPRQQQKKHEGAGAAVAIEGIRTLLARNHTLGHPKACKSCAGEQQMHGRVDRQHLRHSQRFPPWYRRSACSSHTSPVRPMVRHKAGSQSCKASPKSHDECAHPTP